VGGARARRRQQLLFNAGNEIGVGQFRAIAGDKQPFNVVVGDRFVVAHGSLVVVVGWVESARPTTAR
jgi:hypothetical protein